MGSVDKILNSLIQILDGVMQADQQMMEKTKAKVFSALIMVLQMKEMKGEVQMMKVTHGGVLFFYSFLQLP